MVLAQVLVNGILLGGLYACIAIGFSLVWGVLNVINLAHGSMVILGAYIAWALSGATGLDPFLLLPVSAASLFALGFLLQRYLLNRLVEESVFMTLILTFGLNMVLINVALACFTSDIRSVTVPYGRLGLDLGGILVPYTRLAVFVVALLLTVLLFLFTHTTRTGKAILATGLDRDAARLVGIDVKSIYAITFGLGAALAGAAGALIAVVHAFSPVTGESYTMKAFVVVVLGGLGSVPGAIVAGLLLGVAENLASLLLDPGYRDAVSFILLVAVLAFRPQGLIGRRYFGDVKA